jgi:thymidylate synthase (FAD)
MKAEYVDHYLSDKDVANFARQSFARLADNFTEKQNNDLVRFLARGMQSKDWESLIQQMTLVQDPEKAKKLATHIRNIPEHWVPFGHPHISLRMQAPIPIRVQCFKHKIGYVESEESRRYISSRPVLYVPDVFRASAASVKQGSAGEHPASAQWRKSYLSVANAALRAYDNMIAAGICAEQARFVLPQGCEVNWVWTGSLYAFANYFNQRTDSHTQKESRDLAHEVGEIIAPLYPVSWAALTGGEY